MKVFVTGVAGQLGHDVIKELKKRGHTGIASDIAETVDLGVEYAQMDITDKAQVKAAISAYVPDAVIHCAAWTAVDAAEEPENRDKVFAINMDGTRNIAEACKTIDSKLLYVSTDYVFDGQGTVPWDPDCKDYAPLNIYGQSKLEGELMVSGLLDKYFIVRTAWVFGENGNNFVKTMLKLAEKYKEIRVVNDQIGTPTYTPDLARLLVDIVETEKYGYYHATNEGGYISWYEFACEIFRIAGKSIRVIPVTTEEYGISRARRPFNGRLDKGKLTQSGFESLPDWKDALDRFVR